MMISMRNTRHFMQNWMDQQKLCLIIFIRSSATFHPRVINKTNIILTSEQMSPFSKCTASLKQWIKTLAGEAETGINICLYRNLIS